MMPSFWGGRTVDTVAATPAPPPRKYGVTHWSFHVASSSEGFDRRAAGRAPDQLPLVKIKSSEHGSIDRSTGIFCSTR